MAALTFGFILLVLLPIVAVGYIVWDYKRKTAQRAEVSAGRLSELMGVATQVQVQPPSATPTPTQTQVQPQSQAQPQPVNPVERAPVVPPAPRSEPAVAAAPAARIEIGAAPAGRIETAAALTPRAELASDGPPLYAPRERVLNPAQTLAFLLLKTGLPDHVVFARVTLASILEAGPGLSGFARDEQARRLAALTVDFVIADRNMRPLAVVELAAADQGSVAQTDRASARTRLVAAGVRYVELDARALPRKDGIRAAVLGDAPAKVASASPTGVTR